MNAVSQCDLCGAPPEQSKKTWPDAAKGSASEGYVTCLNCGLVYCRELPTSDMAEFHNQQYASPSATLEPDRLHKLDPEHSRKRLFAPAYQQWAQKLLKELVDQTKSEKKGSVRVLEVGCAAGGILKAARDLGMDAVGTEVSAEAASFGIQQEKLDIRIGLLEDLKLPAASFDIVLLHDVIEHVPSPMHVMKECARLLKPGGVLGAHTVNVDALTVDFAGSDFFLADTTGGHVVLFTPDTLEKYSRALGLFPLSTKTRGFRIVQRERDRKEMKGLRKACIRLVENIGHELVKRSNRGHFVMLVARKPV